MWVKHTLHAMLRFNLHVWAWYAFPDCVGWWNTLESWDSWDSLERWWQKYGHATTNHIHPTAKLIHTIKCTKLAGSFLIPLLCKKSLFMLAAYLVNIVSGWHSKLLFIGKYTHDVDHPYCTKNSHKMITWQAQKILNRFSLYSSLPVEVPDVPSFSWETHSFQVGGQSRSSKGDQLCWSSVKSSLAILMFRKCQKCNLNYAIGSALNVNKSWGRSCLLSQSWIIARAVYSNK